MSNPVYTLGSNDPRTFHSFSGADIKIYKLSIDAAIDSIASRPNDHKGSIAHGEYLIECMGFSFAEREGKGSLIFAHLSGAWSRLSDSEYHLLVLANDEYGNQSVMALKSVRDIERTFGMSIDDTTIEYTVTIKFGEVLLWKKTETGNK